MPGRLGATYVGEDGNKHTPVMLHRAIFGSLERFIGILIEHHAGNLPLWLAPVQVRVLTITSDANEYAEDVAVALREAGLRAETDLRNEKISYKFASTASRRYRCCSPSASAKSMNAMSRCGASVPRSRKCCHSTMPSPGSPGKCANAAETPNVMRPTV